MNHCTHCGAALDGAVNFCKNCGEKLDKGKPLALSEKTPTAGIADYKTPTDYKKLAIIIGAGVAVLALALVLVFTVFLNKPETERPLTVAELLDLGEKYLLDLDYEQALVQYLAVIEIEPKNERGYTGAAEAYVGMGDRDSAVEILWEGYEKTSSTEIWHMISEVAAEQEASVETAPEPTITENETEAAPVQSAQVGDIIEFGGYDWRVLDVQDGKVLVISEYVFSEFIPYHNEYTDITWADSDIRAYLNGEFYNSFDERDRVQIIQTQVINNNNPWDARVRGGSDTQDYIFLLSIEEVVRYFGDSGQLANDPGYDVARIADEYSEARIAYDMNDGSIASWWWLRSPGLEYGSAAFVDDYIGSIWVVGSRISEFGGVRPAMWITPE